MRCNSEHDREIEDEDQDKKDEDEDDDDDEVKERGRREGGEDSTVFWSTPQSSASLDISSPVRFESKKAISCSMRCLKRSPRSLVTTRSPAMVKSAARMKVKTAPMTG